MCRNAFISAVLARVLLGALGPADGVATHTGTVLAGSVTVAHRLDSMPRFGLRGDVSVSVAISVAITSLLNFSDAASVVGSWRVW